MVICAFTVLDTANAENTTVHKSGSYINLNNDSSVVTINTSDELHTVTPTITVWGKPSCQSCHKNVPYRWYKRTWVDYCPHCHRYNCLLINPKGVPEKELTCKYCDSDYDIFCGHDKCANYYRHKNYVLRSK